MKKVPANAPGFLFGKSAIDKAVEEFRIEPARRFRLIAEPVE